MNVKIFPMKHMAVSIPENFPTKNIFIICVILHE